ncbi:MAG: hypothetical protein GYB66_10125 [Chloroflexi bacterium]|nr:hypothetical protein [Chloroflexota bacterium]
MDEPTSASQQPPEDDQTPGRRHQPDEVEGSDSQLEPGDQMVSPVSGFNTSPVRPQSPDAPRQPIMPSMPRPSRPEPPVRADPTPTEEVDISQLSVEEKAANALNRLRRKMQAVAEEFNQGKINRAQFHAIYQRYQEQRDITEQLIKRDPQTGAWQTVVQPGHTSFLRAHFEARVESFAIYHVESQKQIIRNGNVQIPSPQVSRILQRLSTVLDSSQAPGVVQRRLPGDRSVVVVPGESTVAIVIFSFEPAAAQLEMVQDMHDDFERANHQLLVEHQLDPREMVFPHRALFEQ